jgi:hypothetical protein
MPKKRPTDPLAISPQLHKKLKRCDPEVQQLVSALHSEVVKLRKLDVRHQVEDLSSKARIKALTDQLESLVGPTTLADQETKLTVEKALRILQEAEKTSKKPLQDS